MKAVNSLLLVLILVLFQSSFIFQISDILLVSFAVGSLVMGFTRIEKFRLIHLLLLFWLMTSLYHGENIIVWRRMLRMLLVVLSIDIYFYSMKRYGLNVEYLKYLLIFFILAIVYGFSGVDRLKLWYTEPSVLALTVFLVYILYLYFNDYRLNVGLFVGVNVALILINSVTAVLCAIVLSMFFFRAIQNKLIVVLVLLTVILSINFLDISYYEERLVSIFSGEDNSFSQRIIGSFLLAESNITNIMIGNGVGTEVLLNKYSASGVDFVSVFNVRVNNGIASIFLETGVIGLVLFLVTYLRLSNFRLTLVLLTVLFSHGAYYWTPYMLVFYLLSQEYEFRNI